MTWCTGSHIQCFFSLCVFLLFSTCDDSRSAKPYERSVASCPLGVHVCYNELHTKRWENELFEEHRWRGRLRLRIWYKQKDVFRVLHEETKFCEGSTCVLTPCWCTAGCLFSALPTLLLSIQVFSYISLSGIRSTTGSPVSLSRSSLCQFQVRMRVCAMVWDVM